MKDFFKVLTGHLLPSSDNAYRPHLLRKPWLLFFLSVILTSEAVYIAALGVGQPAKNFLGAVLPGEVISLTNVERSHAGNGDVKENSLLDAAAQAKANDMAAKGYFSHVGPDGKEPWAWIAEAGYAYRYAGENLAVRFENSSDVVNAWMASPSHRANIVKPVYKEIGVGVAQGMYEGAPATFVVQYFGTELNPAETASLSSEEVPSTPAQATVAGAATEETGVTTPSSSPATPTGADSEPEEIAPVSTPNSGDFSMREAAQVFVRAGDATQNSAMWTLGGIAGFLILLLALALFVHIEIQPTEMLAGGAVVALMAIALYGINASLTSGLNSQSAAAIESARVNGIVGDEAAFSQVELGG
jgi:uncharacterized protein YkwD